MELLLPPAALIIWVSISALTFLLFLLALVSILRSDFEDHTVKLLWGIIVVLVPLVGPILYFLLGKKQKINYSG